MLLFLEYHNHQMFDSLLNTWLYNYWITVCMFILKKEKKMRVLIFTPL